MKYPVKIAVSILLATSFWSCQKTPVTSPAPPKEFTIAFYNLENLFDTEYLGNLRINASNARYYEPGAARRFYAGIEINWQ